MRIGRTILYCALILVCGSRALTARDASALSPEKSIEVAAIDRDILKNVEEVVSRYRQAQDRLVEQDKSKFANLLNEIAELTDHLYSLRERRLGICEQGSDIKGIIYCLDSSLENQGIRDLFTSGKPYNKDDAWKELPSNYPEYFDRLFTVMRHVDRKRTAFTDEPCVESLKFERACFEFALKGTEEIITIGLERKTLANKLRALGRGSDTTKDDKDLSNFQLERCRLLYRLSDLDFAEKKDQDGLEKLQILLRSECTPKLLAQVNEALSRHLSSEDVTPKENVSPTFSVAERLSKYSALSIEPESPPTAEDIRDDSVWVMLVTGVSGFYVIQNEQGDNVVLKNCATGQIRLFPKNKILHSLSKTNYINLLNDAKAKQLSLKPDIDGPFQEYLAWLYTFRLKGFAGTTIKSTLLRIADDPIQCLALAEIAHKAHWDQFVSSILLATAPKAFTKEYEGQLIKIIGHTAIKGNVPLLMSLWKEGASGPMDARYEKIWRKFVNTKRDGESRRVLLQNTLDQLGDGRIFNTCLLCGGTGKVRKSQAETNAEMNTDTVSALSMGGNGSFVGPIHSFFKACPKCDGGAVTYDETILERRKILIAKIEDIEFEFFQKLATLTLDVWTIENKNSKAIVSKKSNIDLDAKLPLNDDMRREAAFEKAKSDARADITMQRNIDNIVKMPCYFLKNDTKIRAAKVVDGGDELSIKSFDGKYVTIKGSDVVKIVKDLPLDTEELKKLKVILAKPKSKESVPEIAPETPKRTVPENSPNFGDGSDVTREQLTPGELRRRRKEEQESRR